MINLSPLLNSLRSALGQYLVVAISILMLSACVQTRQGSVDSEVGRLRMEQPVLVLPPVIQAIKYDQHVRAIGHYLNIEVPRRITGQTVYAEQVPTLQPTLTWSNLISNGAINRKEACTLARTVGCNTVIAMHVLDVNPYPPFRTVVNMEWIDATTGEPIGRMFQDINLADTETEMRFAGFVGSGPGTKIYEMWAYSEAKLATAKISPQEFQRFVAAYSMAVLFGETEETPWWYLWELF